MCYGVSSGSRAEHCNAASCGLTPEFMRAAKRPRMERIVSCGPQRSDEMFDWIAKLLGREVVWLQDFDGEVNKRWAKPTPFGLVCWRMYPVSKALLLPNGEVKGPSYVASWKPARSAANA